MGLHYIWYTTLLKSFKAPEVLGQERYGPKVDLWSIGAIMYELLVGLPPFNASNHIQLLKMINDSTEVNIPGHISGPARDLLLNLLQKDPNKRCEFEELFNHPFLNPGGPLLRNTLASGKGSSSQLTDFSIKVPEETSELPIFKNAVYLIIHSDKITEDVQQKLLILQRATLNLLKIKDPALKIVALDILKDVRQIMMHNLSRLDDTSFVELSDHLISVYAEGITREAIAFERVEAIPKAIECYERVMILLGKGNIHDLVKSRCFTLTQKSAESQK